MTTILAHSVLVRQAEDLATVHISLTRGLVALADRADEDLLSSVAWYPLSPKRWATYAATRIDGRTVYMHRFLLGLRKGDRRQVDHINGNGLDNRRSNLRVCTQSENQHNQVHKTPKYGFRGIYPVGRKWQACIGINGSWKYLGLFASKEDGAAAYDRAAKDAFGDFALLNFSENNVALLGVAG